MCKHYWLVPEANGPTSKAVCKLCGATQEMYNSADFAKKLATKIKQSEAPMLAFFKKMEVLR